MNWILTILIACFALCSEAQFQSMVFNWQESSNRLSGSVDTLWQGNGGPMSYSRPYQAPNPLNRSTNSYTLTITNFMPGMNRFAVTQINTNEDGSAVCSVDSGEITVMNATDVGITVALMTSTNLARSWTVASTNYFVFPTQPGGQQFWLSGISIQPHQNLFVQPPPPGP